MSTKKRFSIAPDLASGIRNTIQSASANQGQHLHYDMMSVDVIEPDPANPRKLLISRDELLTRLNPADLHYEIKSRELEALQELAESITQVGIRNAIEVYKEGEKYRIMTGQRRFFAAIIANQKSVPVRINQKPDAYRLRYTQWVENINRQDLSLWEKLNNLLAIAEAYKQVNHNDFDEKILQKLLGVSNTQAYRYFCLLNADPQILELVETGKVNNLKIVQELSTMKDKVALKQILSWISTSKDEITTLADYRAAAGKKPKLSKSSSNQAISLGKITHTGTAKYLFDTVLSDKRFDKHRPVFKNIDWSSPKAVAKAFKNLFKTIENELSTEEMA